MQRRASRTTSFFFMAITAAGVAGESAGAPGLSLDDRVSAQAAIERVYWNHRVWPTENRVSKPALSAVLTEADLRAKVRDYLAQSEALDVIWHRPIDARQLQAELDRMARDTRDGATLRELFDALGNDPALIAETLARQNLASRLVHDLYAADTRFHTSIRKTAEADLTSCRSNDCLKTNGPGYGETTWTRAPQGADLPAVDGARPVVRLDADDWAALTGRLEREFGRASGALPLGTVSRLEETPDAFSVTTVLAENAIEITTATRSWAKVSFDVWWRERRETLGASSPSTTGAFTLPARVGSGCTPGTWSPSAIPAPRESHTAIWTGSEMIVWGGFFEGYPVHDSGRRYNPATDSWAKVSSGSGVPQDRALASAVWTGTEMIVWGGKAYNPATNGTYCLNTGGRYDPATDRWVATSTGANVPSPRCVHVAAWTGAKMIVWGGTPTPPPFDNTSLNSGGVYDPSTDAWTPTSIGANTPPAPRYPATAWTGSELIVWGGNLESGYLNTGGRYNPSDDSWTATALGSNVPAARVGATAVWTGSEFIVWGGYDSNSRYLQTGGRYHPATGTWLATSVGTNVPTPRVGHTAVWTGSEMIIWGRSQGPAFPNNGGRYRPSTDSWLPISSVGSGTPVKRSRHTALWTGSEMIVWGGNTDSLYNSLGNTGGRYDPRTDSWVATSLGGTPPAGRYGHSGVWTGAELIVWGGYANANYLNSGGRYNAATDTWAPTSTAGVPQARRSHTAVWTGTQMIVWGGGDAVELMSTGGRYNPSTDSWSATALDGAASARSGHSAVWTGHEMVVWGGAGRRDGSIVYPNKGARYDPVADSWTSTSTSAAVPEGRTWHSAVWTGSEMIVWGGQGASLLSDGGRYDPRLDRWVATSTASENPVARVLHQAIWTGQEMIVWGGTDGVTAGINTGGRYDPRTDRWTATSTGHGVASGRRNFDAIWTGDEMVVWGGSGSSDWNSDGGRYNPRLDAWISIPWVLGSPTPREFPTLVWTGTEMLIWGGVRSGTYYDAAASYCIADCPEPMLYFQDLDGDGSGEPTVSVAACTAPAGYVDQDSDCDDTDPATFPGATEVKDGKPNDCGSEVVDEVSGATVWIGSSLGWAAQPGATAYQVIRSSSADFTADCFAFAPTAANYVDDPSVPASGSAYFYLVRSASPAPPGSWGRSSGGLERGAACLE